MDSAGFRSPPQGDMRLRRRKVRKRKPQEAGSLRRLCKRAALLVTLAGAALYGLGINHQLAALRDQFGPYAMAATAIDINATLGRPGRIDDGGRRWTYVSGERTLIVSFDGDRQVERIDCLPTTVQMDVCPLAGAVGLTNSEAEIRKALGRPSGVADTRSGKVLTYAGLGYRFYLGRDQVQAITHDRPAGGWAYIAAIFWQAVP